MKICYLTEKPVHVGKWIDYFSSKGHEVYQITFRDNPSENAKNYFLWEPIPRCYLTYILNLNRIKRIIHRIAPDVIHAWYATNFGFLGAFSGFKPFVISVAGSDLLVHGSNSLFFDRIVKYVLARADAVNSVSKHMTERLISLGVKPEKIHQFPKGIDIGKFNIEGRTTVEASGKIRVISIRNFEKVYNLELLLDAVPYVIENYKDIEFVLIGDGSLRDSLINKARETGIQGKVDFKGFVDNKEIPKYLKSSDIYVSTSLSDGCSVSLLEAMACGAFPVVSDIPANRDIVDDGVNGYLFDVNSPEDLANKLLLAIEEKDLRRAASIGNYELIKDNFEMELIMERLLNIYKELSGAS